MLASQPEVSDLLFTSDRPAQVESYGELKPVALNPPIEKLTPFQNETIALNIVGDKDDPPRSDLPSNSNHLMIDGLANANIDRLSELDITDAQILSCQNPFTLWVRLPYEFGLIVDWISQAPLYVCVREEGFRAARAQQINNIRKFYAVLSDPLSSPQLCDELKLQRAFVAPLLTSLNDNPSFVRLQEVERAMLGFDETTRQASDPKMAPNPTSPAALVAAH